MSNIAKLKQDYPWIRTPLVVGAPMRLIALADMAVEISKAGGIGFIGAGTDVADLSSHLSKAQELLLDAKLPSRNSTMPLGIGFINWGADLVTTIPVIAHFKPAAVWFFAPSSSSSLQEWTTKTREVSPDTRIWVQVGSVADARDTVAHARPDVLVVQGTDAGGHGLAQGASLICLLPEVADAISGPILIGAGGICEARGAAAALVLGASGIVMGTRFLACPEANIQAGYRAEVLRTNDGGQTTARTKVYDRLRGTTGWAESHNARGILNRSYYDAVGGMEEEENKRLYKREMGKGDDGWGVEARMTAYAGGGVGLVRGVMGAGEIVVEVREGARGLLGAARGML